MSGYGFHWSPCSGRGGGGLALLIIAGVAAIAATRKTVSHAAADVFRAIVLTVEIAAIVIISAVGLCILAGLAAVALAVRRRILARRLAVPRVVASVVPAALADPERAELSGRVVPTLPAARAGVVTPFRVPVRSRRRGGEL